MKFSINQKVSIEKSVFGAHESYIRAQKNQPPNRSIFGLTFGGSVYRTALFAFFIKHLPLLSFLPLPQPGSDKSEQPQR